MNRYICQSIKGYFEYAMFQNTFRESDASYLFLKSELKKYKKIHVNNSSQFIKYNLENRLEQLCDKLEELCIPFNDKYNVDSYANRNKLNIYDNIDLFYPAIILSWCGSYDYHDHVLDNYGSLYYINIKAKTYFIQRFGPLNPLLNYNHNSFFYVFIPKDTSLFLDTTRPEGMTQRRMSAPNIWSGIDNLLDYGIRAKVDRLEIAKRH
jgi:hypothetical protein